MTLTSHQIRNRLNAIYDSLINEARLVEDSKYSTSTQKPTLAELRKSLKVIINEAKELEEEI